MWRVDRITKTNSKDNEIVKVISALIILFITLVFSYFAIHIEPPASLWYILIMGLFLTLMLSIGIPLFYIVIMFFWADIKKEFRPTFKIMSYELDILISIIMASYYLGYALTKTNRLLILFSTIIISFFGTCIFLKFIDYFLYENESDDVVFDASEIRLKNDYDKYSFQPQEEKKVGSESDLGKG